MLFDHIFERLFEPAGEINANDYLVHNSIVGRFNILDITQANLMQAHPLETIPAEQPLAKIIPLVRPEAVGGQAIDAAVTSVQEADAQLYDIRRNIASNFPPDNEPDYLEKIPA